MTTGKKASTKASIAAGKDTPVPDDDETKKQQNKRLKLQYKLKPEKMDMTSMKISL